MPHQSGERTKKSFKHDSPLSSGISYSDAQYLHDGWVVSYIFVSEVRAEPWYELLSMAFFFLLSNPSAFPLSLFLLLIDNAFTTPCREIAWRGRGKVLNLKSEWALRRQSQNLRNVSRRFFYSEMLNDKLSALANLWHYTSSLTRSPLILDRRKKTKNKRQRFTIL